jgi:hypothetical protein
MSEKELKQAREWIKECLGTWRELETEDDVDQLTDSQVQKGIAKHFSGGIEEFKRSCL